MLGKAISRSRVIAVVVIAVVVKTEIENFVEENKEQLNKEHIDFKYVLINPKNLIGIDEFNQDFFDKIDFIENEISKNVNFKTIFSNLELEGEIVTVKDFSLSENQKEIEDKNYNLPFLDKRLICMTCNLLLFDF